MMEVTVNTERELKRIRLYYACYDSKEIVLKTSVIKWKSPSARLNESKLPIIITPPRINAASNQKNDQNDTALLGNLHHSEIYDSIEPK